MKKIIIDNVTDSTAKLIVLLFVFPGVIISLSEALSSEDFEKRNPSLTGVCCYLSIVLFITFSSYIECHIDLIFIRYLAWYVCVVPLKLPRSLQ